MTTDRQRQETINGLRELADFLAAHPDVPVRQSEITYAVLGRDDAYGTAEIETIAASLGVPVTGTAGRPVTSATTHFHATRVFGPVSYRAFYVRQQAMADYAAHMSYERNVRADTAA